MLLPLAPVSLIVQLFDAFLAFSLLFGSFLLYVQEGSAASVQVDMQIEAAARLKSTVSDLPALEISRNISFGAPRAYIDFLKRKIRTFAACNHVRMMNLRFLYLYKGLLDYACAPCTDFSTTLRVSKK